MAQFSVNAQRFDPYKNFKFRVKWDGRYVAGVSKVAILLRDGLRCVGELVGDLVGSLIEVCDAVGSALSGRRVLHVVVGKALSLGSDTTLRGLTECALLAGVCKIGFLLCH